MSGADLAPLPNLSTPSDHVGFSRAGQQLAIREDQRTSTRPRSDTIASTSSSSSSAYIQTPQTPSLFGILYAAKEALNAKDAGRLSSDGADAVDAEGLTLNRQTGSELSDLRPCVGTESLADSVDQRGGVVLDEPAQAFTPRNPQVVADAFPTPGYGDTPDLIARALEPLVAYPFPTVLSAPASDQIDRSSDHTSHTSEKTRKSVRGFIKAKMTRTGSKSSLSRYAEVVQAGNEASQGQDVESPARRPKLMSLLSRSRTGSTLSMTQLRPNMPVPQRDVLSAAIGDRSSTAPLDFQDTSRVTLETYKPSTHVAAAVLPAVQFEQSGKIPAPGRSETNPKSQSAPSLGRPLVPHTSLFQEKLPREVHIQIFKALLSSFDESKGRWRGKEAGRRELIKLTRVSKSWQSLCLDGQIWPIPNLTPFASHLHPNTLSRIVESTKPFMTELSLLGLDNLFGTTLIQSLTRTTLPLLSLTHLDLRGCRSLITSDITSLLTLTPRVVSLNFKGLESITSDTLRQIAQCVPNLEELDVSRCWNLTLTDITVFLRRMSDSQAWKLKYLATAGIKGYGNGYRDLLGILSERCGGLEVLDLGGCVDIRDEQWEMWRSALETKGIVSRLRRLNISGCTGLTSKAFVHLKGIVPDLEVLEMAGVVIGGGEEERDIVQLLKGLAKLKKVDMEDCGQMSDAVLECLVSACGQVLEDVKFGFCKGFTPDGLIRFIRGCPALRVFEVDNTNANNAVMREWMRRHHRKDTSLSVIDCRGVTTAGYAHVAAWSRPRHAWGEGGIQANPFGYTPEEVEGNDEGGSGSGRGKGVIQCHEAWKRVGTGRGWREMRGEWEDRMRRVDMDIAQPSSHEVAIIGSSVKRPRRRRGTSFGLSQDVGGGADQRGSCFIM